MFHSDTFCRRSIFRRREPPGPPSTCKDTPSNRSCFDCIRSFCPGTTLAALAPVQTRKDPANGEKNRLSDSHHPDRKTYSPFPDPSDETGCCSPGQGSTQS